MTVIFGLSGRNPTYEAGQWTSNGLFWTLLARLRPFWFPFSVAFIEIVQLCFVSFLKASSYMSFPFLFLYFFF